MSWLDADPEADARCRALLALPDDASAAPALLAALRDQHWRVRRLAVERLSKLAPAAALADQLVALLSERDEPGARSAAEAVLARLGATALPAVAALLEHPDAWLRRAGAVILGRLARPEAVPALVARLADADANVRAAAAEALGRLGGQAALDALEGLLEADEPVLRVCALEGLADGRRAPALPRLAPLLADPWTRTSAFRALGLVDHPTAFALVTRAVASRTTRDAALGALGARGRPLPAAFEAGLRAVVRAAPDGAAWLSRALEADALDRRLGALVATHALNEPMLALAVARAARPGPAVDLALEVLVRLGVRGARMLLSAPGSLAGLPGASQEVAAEALLRLSEPSLVAPLVALLRLGDADLAQLAIVALGRTRARTAIPPLLPCLADEVLGAPAALALVTLAESWPAEVRDALLPLARGRPRPHVVRAWAGVVGEEAHEVLQRASEDADEAVRAAAAGAAPAVPGHAAALVRAALADASSLVRRAAARALAQLSPADGWPLVAGALADGDPTVLAFAAAAAADLDCLDARARLAELARDAEPRVALAALDALSVLDGLDDEVLARAAAPGDPEVLVRVLTLAADRPAVVALAQASLAHPRWDVRVAAARVLAVSGGPAGLAAVRAAAAREPDAQAREALEELGGAP